MPILFDFSIFLILGVRMIWVRSFKILSCGFMFRFTLESKKGRQVFYGFHGKVRKYIRYGQFTVWRLRLLHPVYVLSKLWFNCFGRWLPVPYIQDEMHFKWHIAIMPGVNSCNLLIVLMQFSFCPSIFTACRCVPTLPWHYFTNVRFLSLSLMYKLLSQFICFYLFLVFHSKNCRMRGCAVYFSSMQ
jgi:hypothetical protein